MLEAPAEQDEQGFEEGTVFSHPVVLSSLIYQAKLIAPTQTVTLSVAHPQVLRQTP